MPVWDEPLHLPLDPPLDGRLLHNRSLAAWQLLWSSCDWVLETRQVQMVDDPYQAYSFTSTSGEPPPICCLCQTPLTVQHFMLDCPQFAVKRAKYFTVSSLKDLFYHINAHVIVDFIKDIEFYYHLWFHTSPSLTLIFLTYILL